jgi:hypothetical protein
VSSRYERIKIPEDQIQGFSKWAREYYLAALSEARFIAALSGPEHSETLVAAIFDKLASPLIYLKEEWMRLPLEEIVRYCPHLKPKLEEARKVAEEGAKKLAP